MYDPLTKMFRALGNQRRRMVLEMICDAARTKQGRPRPFATVTEIARRLKIAQPGVSQYVEKLFNAKLIDIKRAGPAHLCIPVTENIARLRDVLGEMTQS